MVNNILNKEVSVLQLTITNKSISSSSNSRTGEIVVVDRKSKIFQWKYFFQANPQTIKQILH